MTADLPFPRRGLRGEPVVIPNALGFDLSTVTGAWLLDPAQTAITFEVKASWLGKVSGSLTARGGGGAVGVRGAILGSLSIDAASASTGDPDRDARLRGPGFFDTQRFPTIEFFADHGRLATGGQVELSGTLTIAGQARPVQLLTDVTATDGAVRVTAQLDLDRSDWGLNWLKRGGSLSTQLQVDAWFRRP